MSVTLKSRLPQISRELPMRVNRVLEVGAHEIADSAKSRVPFKTGRLHDAIHVEDRGAQSWAVVAGDRDKDVFYGHMVEFGTTGDTGTPAQPFLIPAVEANKAAIKAAVTLALKRL